MKQLVLGMTFRVGPNIFVFAANTPLVVAVNREYRVTVSQALVRAGVLPKIQAGKIRFPKGDYTVVVVVDDDQKTAVVRRPSPEIVAASLAAGGTEAVGIAEKALKRLTERADEFWKSVDWDLMAATVEDEAAKVREKLSTKKS